MSLYNTSATQRFVWAFSMICFDACAAINVLIHAALAFAVSSDTILWSHYRELPQK